MAPRKRKKKSYWSPPAVVGRVVWGRGGFKGAMRRVWHDWSESRTVASIRHDPDTGTLKAAGVRQRKDGTWEVKPPKPVPAKRRVEQMQARIAAESDRHARYLRAQSADRAAPMTQRVKRRADGTFNGSTTAAPRPADTAYEQAVRAAERAEQRANRLLGYRD